MIGFIVWLARAVHAACQDLPINRFVSRLRNDPTRGSGGAALLLGAAYAVAGAFCAQGAASGWSGWLHLGVLVFWWSALKLLGHGFVAIIRTLCSPAGERVSPVFGDGVDAGVDRGCGVPISAEVGGGRRR